MVRVDSSLQVSSPPESTSNADYFSFGDPIHAPLAGTFFSSENMQVDQNPGCDPFDPGAANGINFLFMDVGGGAALLFSHTMQGSIPALGPFGTPIPAGTFLGNVGSGGTCSVHLHNEARTIGGGDPSRPIQLTGVEAGLNPVETIPGCGACRAGGFARASWCAPQRRSAGT